MQKRYRLLALILAAMLLLTGCGYTGESFWEADREMVPFSEMTYTRPALDEFRTLLDECTRLAEEGKDFDALVDAIWGFTAAYNTYYTNYCLADIRYCLDTTDIYWTDEYNYCMETSSEVDAGLDQLYYTLADCVFREDLESDDLFGEGFFDDYEGESLWDDTFTALMEEENALITEYYDLSSQRDLAEPYGEAYQLLTLDLCQLYVDLIAQRQEIAAYAGYEDYHHFAYDFYYARDYTPEQETAYLSAVQEELVPLYKYICQNGVDGLYYYECTEEEAFSYVQGIAETMGGQVLEAFEWMRDAGLYDITYSENKYNASFETFLSDYYVPFVFMNPDGSSYDKMTFSHEFGHFCNDFASYGTGVGIDVAEIFSQSMEYLGLIYGDSAEELEKLSMFSSLCVQVEQSAYAAFEQRAYQLTGDDLNVQEICKLFGQVSTEFGFDVFGVDVTFFTGVPHFFTNPMYVFSYVVSNDAALQVYQLELEESGAGLQVFQDNLTTEEGYFLAFLESAGLQSPFEEGRLEAVRQTFEDALK